MCASSAHTTRDRSTGRTDHHTDDITSFSDLGLNLPFEYGDAIYDTKHGTVRIPRAIAPSENGGIRVYSAVYSVSERRYGDLKITDTHGPSLNSSSMKVLLMIIEEDTTEIIDADRVVA